MNLLGITPGFECTGNRGIRFCEDNYPSGMLPESEFTPKSLHSKTCTVCRKAMNDVRSHLYDYAGTTSDKYYALPKNVRDKIYNVIWYSMYSNGATKVPVSRDKLSKGMSLAMAISGVQTVDEFYKKSEMEMENSLHVAESMMSNGRSEVTAKQTSEKRGFVYIITNPAYPGYVKIGKALDVLSRLSSYQTYSPRRDYVLEDYKFFSNRKAAEDLMKKLLSGEQGDAEGEWFKVGVDMAKRTLSNVKGVHIWRT
jgi:hypothetical protein